MRYVDGAITAIVLGVLVLSIEVVRDNRLGVPSLRFGYAADIYVKFSFHSVKVVSI